MANLAWYVFQWLCRADELLNWLCWSHSGHSKPLREGRWLSDRTECTSADRCSSSLANEGKLEGGAQMEHSKGRADLDEPTPGDTSTLSFLADGADTRGVVEGP